ncbi:MAG TPA: response regulator [Candidatus Angelobacter sp.]|nr:response regulator [Candidatus Angelobacter sp.]
MPARILIIEDNPTNMELMLYLLNAFGYEVVTASDGREGIEAALADPSPDLIICDVEMPRLNGYQVAEQLRTTLDLKRIPLVAVTAYAMVGDREKVIAAGFSGYISKPISPDSFMQQIESFLHPEKRPQQGPALSQAKGTSAAAVASGRATILVVDDVAVNLDLIRSTLEPSGYTVIATHSVEEALRLIQENCPDIILSDLHMPFETGFRFLERLKADPAMASIPFVLFTSSTTDHVEDVRQRALALGANKFVLRPIEPEALLRVIDSVLQQVSEERHVNRSDR